MRFDDVKYDDDNNNIIIIIISYATYIWTTKPSLTPIFLKTN